VQNFIHQQRHVAQPAAEKPQHLLMQLGGAPAQTMERRQKQLASRQLSPTVRLGP